MPDKMRRVALLAALLTCSAIAWSCASLQACLALYPMAKPSHPGIGPEETKLAEAVQGYGAEAVPYLVQLLDNGNENARQLAGYTLCDIDGLKPEHLPALIRARRRGDGWIPRAIAHVGTPEAVECLVDDLKQNPQNQTQVTAALSSLGAKAAPALAELLACMESCNDDLLDVSSFVLAEMKDGAPLVVVPRLLQIAGDGRYALSARRHAVAAIGALGGRAQDFAPQLNALKKADALLEGIVLAADNIDDIFYLGDRIVALAGMAHMMINQGFLLRVEKNDTGRYTATVWKRLPAAPETMALMEGQRLLVHTDGGGSVIVDRDGEMRMAECLRERKE